MVSGTGYSSLRQGRQKRKQQGSGTRKEMDLSVTSDVFDKCSRSNLDLKN